MTYVGAQDDNDGKDNVVDLVLGIGTEEKEQRKLYP
jgi:hypothetical protein